MANEANGIFVTDPSQPDAPPYRPFRERPHGLYIKAVLDHIRETGQPETFEGLYRGKIDRGAKFRILQKIQIDRHKRPNGDMAPCPRCGYEDKFLDGAFAWFPDLQFCAVIGHCCAAKEELDQAEREFKWREKRDREESYLLERLPTLSAKAELLDQLRSPAGEALRIYREFRRGSPFVHKHLREIKAQRGGQLKLVEILRSAEEEGESDYFGPAGFRGRGHNEAESRDIDLGFIAGQTAVSKDYNPIMELNDALRVLDSFDLRPNEDEALELIVSMNEDEPRRRAAVAILQAVDQRYGKVTRKLSDFWHFFTRPNIERLNAYGAHSLNPLPFQASFESGAGRTVVCFRHQRKECRLSFANKFTIIPGSGGSAH